MERDALQSKFAAPFFDAIYGDRSRPQALARSKLSVQCSNIELPKIQPRCSSTGLAGAWRIATSEGDREARLLGRRFRHCCVSGLS
jgi:hypothetical protein